mmetsp:Transcript_128/g.150  ORF Transcript_128/g.150 Transcript_128/m.150 type:complete len:156 (-) Transcript_128:662-1129(-)
MRSTTSLFCFCFIILALFNTSIEAARNNRDEIKPVNQRTRSRSSSTKTKIPKSHHLIRSRQREEADNTDIIIKRELLLPEIFGFNSSSSSSLFKDGRMSHSKSSKSGSGDGIEIGSGDITVTVGIPGFELLSGFLSLFTNLFLIFLIICLLCLTS